jgi:hypothetical protein
MNGTVDIKKIHIWESNGFWVLDFYDGEVIDGSAAIKICSISKPKIVIQKSKYRKHIPIKAVHFQSSKDQEPTK